MQENIDKLKKMAENIQAAKLGKRGEKNHINSYTVIDEYQEWRTECLALIQLPKFKQDRVDLNI